MAIADPAVGSAMDVRWVHRIVPKTEPSTSLRRFRILRLIVAVSALAGSSSDLAVTDLRPIFVCLSF